jgi:FtsZ-binding cell division protein ZapB
MASLEDFKRLEEKIDKVLEMTKTNEILALELEHWRSRGLSLFNENNNLKKYLADYEEGFRGMTEKIESLEAELRKARESK